MVAAAIGDARICTVNLPEVISHFTHLGMPAEAALARTAGQLRGPIASASLSLGDRFCLALARHEGRPAWTADRAWLEVAGGTIILRKLSWSAAEPCAPCPFVG